MLVFIKAQYLSFSEWSIKNYRQKEAHLQASSGQFNKKILNKITYDYEDML